MRILMTTDTIGGVWTFTQELATGLLEQGCSIALVGLGGTPNCAQQRWVLNTTQCWSHRFVYHRVETPLEWMRSNGQAYNMAEQGLLGLAESFKADVLHSNQFCFGALPLPIPKIVTAHSDVLSWAKSCGKAPLDNSTWLRQYISLVRSGLKSADVVVTPTRWMLDALAENWALPKDSRTISNGRTIPCYAPTARRLQAVTAGRVWDPAKGIGSLGSLSSPIPLLVAGENACEAVTGPAVPDGVQLLGHLSEEALLNLFSNSAIYICTSRYEPFGLAPLEAALCGCAVLANDIPSLREVWQDGALYFNDAMSLVSLLRTLHHDEHLLATTQACSLKQAQYYTRDVMASAYLALYEQTLSADEVRLHVA
jgi:glycogen(starch) synthase